MTQSILCCVPDEERAEQILGDLRAGGFYDEEITVHAPARAIVRDVTHGPLVDALAGGVVQGLTGMGVPEDEARAYEGRLGAGAVLVAVRVIDGVRRLLARDILELNRAQAITLVDESASASHWARRA
jgi:hypothetical protein